MDSPIGFLSNRLMNLTLPNVQVPFYLRHALKPSILHIGVGGFHRSHQAVYFDDLLMRYQLYEWGLCGVGIMPQDEYLSIAMHKQNCLYSLILAAGEERSVRIIGSIAKYIFGYRNPETVFSQLANPDIKVVSVIATEAGYGIHENSGLIDFEQPQIQHDLSNPRTPITIYGYLQEGLLRRMRKGLPPFTILSCDNLQNNGTTLKKGLIAFCAERQSLCSKWIERNVSFPNSMVDRITPITMPKDVQYLRDVFQIHDDIPVIAEPYRQWVLEDNFCNQKPPLEKVGVQFTANVADYEKIKIRLLNASHSAMGYLGYLCGHRYIHEVANDRLFRTYLKNMMDVEITPLLKPVVGINLNEYKQNLISRFANQTINDSILRICMNGSAKLPKFIFSSIKEQLEQGGPIRNLTFCIASWLRFLDGQDQNGMAIPLQDPMAKYLTIVAKKIRRGINSPLKSILMELSQQFGALFLDARFLGEVESLLQLIYLKGAIAALDFVNYSTRTSYPE